MIFDRSHLNLKFKVKCTCSILKCGVLETLSKTTEELELLIIIVKNGDMKGKARSEPLLLICHL